jgi:hypothetical protein
MRKYLSYEQAKEVVLAKASPKRQSRISRAEASMLAPAPAFARQFLQSLKLEQNVILGQWRLVIKWLIDSTQLGEALCRELCHHFRNFLNVSTYPSHIPPNFRLRPVGPARNDLSNVVFGRIQPFSKLASAYADFFGQTKDVAAKNLADELKAIAKSRTLAIGVNFPLGQYLMWSTFDRTGGSSDPFAPRPGNTAADFLGELGIKNTKSDYLKGEIFILTAYRLPPGLKPHVPTIFEAYAGSPNYFFRPTEIHGMPPHTMPLAGYEHLPGRTEMIHGVVFANSLVTSPERKGLYSRL